MVAFLPRSGTSMECGSTGQVPPTNSEANISGQHTGSQVPGGSGTGIGCQDIKSNPWDFLEDYAGLLGIESIDNMTWRQLQMRKVAKLSDEWRRMAWSSWHIAASMPRSGEMPTIEKYMRAAINSANIGS